MPSSASLACFLALTFAALGADAPDPLRSRVIDLHGLYVREFGSSATGLVYHHRLDGPRGVAALASPDEIAAGTVNGKPMPYGYGSGIQDVALENGQLLFALCEAHDATRDPSYAEAARSLFRAVQALARISPEPGFVPRGPHPDGRSYYRDSSRDQHAAYVEALWRFGKSPLATPDDRRFIADTLGKIATRMERNGWSILAEDNSHQAHVGWTWLQPTTIGAITLLGVLGPVKDATGDPHWQKLYEEFSAEKDGQRWNKLLSPDSVRTDQPLTLYFNQFDESLAALRRTESDPVRRAQLGELLRRRAERALDANVFDPTEWRRLDWAGERDETSVRAALKTIGFSPDQPATALDVYRVFDRKYWTEPPGEARSMVQKLCYGLATVPLHAALLSEDPKLVSRAEPVVRAMVNEFLRFHEHYDGGENFNRTVILGLLLDARLTELQAAQSENKPSSR